VALPVNARIIRNSRWRSVTGNCSNADAMSSVSRESGSRFRYAVRSGWTGPSLTLAARHWSLSSIPHRKQHCACLQLSWTHGWS